MNVPIKTQTFAMLLADWMGYKDHPEDAIPELAGVDTAALAHELMADITRAFNDRSKAVAV